MEKLLSNKNQIKILKGKEFFYIPILFSIIYNILFFSQILKLSQHCKRAISQIAFFLHLESKL